MSFRIQETLSAKKKGEIKSANDYNFASFLSWTGEQLFNHYVFVSQDYVAS